jgi:hypothetical protein
MTLGAPDCYGNGCWQSINGKDTSTGFTWPPVVNSSTANFQLLANPTSGSVDATSVYNYMKNSFQTVTGHKGTQTQALYQQVDQMGGGSTQDPYIILPSSDVKDLYISYWAKFQPDMLTKGNGFRALFEFKTTDTDYRLSLCAMVSNGTAYWRALGDGYVPSYQTFWQVNNTSVPVPVGQWFKVELFWHRSTASDGRAWMAINGQVIADHAGANMGPNKSPINRIMVNQLYAASSYPIYQWIDDLQVWSTFPTATSGNAWYDPPYAPH